MATDRESPAVEATMRLVSDHAGRPLYTPAELLRLTKDRGPFAADRMRAALVWAARTLTAADAAVKAEHARAESALAELRATKERPNV